MADIMKPAHMADALHLQVRLPDQQFLRPIDPKPGDIILHGVSGKPPEQPCKILRADMDLTGQAVHIRDSRGICFNSFYYRSHILAVERMLCLRMLPVNTGKMHQKFIALDRKSQVVQTVFLIGKKRSVDPLLKILSLFRANEKVRSFPAYFPDVIRQSPAEGQESGPPAFGVVPVAVRRVGSDQDPFARVQDDILPGQGDRPLAALRLEPVVQGKAFWAGNGFLEPAVPMLSMVRGSS